MYLLRDTPGYITSSRAVTSDDVAIGCYKSNPPQNTHTRTTPTLISRRPLVLVGCAPIRAQRFDLSESNRGENTADSPHSLLSFPWLRSQRTYNVCTEITHLLCTELSRLQDDPCFFSPLSVLFVHTLAGPTIDPPPRTGTCTPSFSPHNNTSESIRLVFGPETGGNNDAQERTEPLGYQCLEAKMQLSALWMISPCIHMNISGRLECLQNLHGENDGIHRCGQLTFG